MKLSLGTLLLSAGSGGGGAATMAFAPPSKYHNRRVRLAAASGGGGDVDAPAPTKKVLTAADVVAKSKSSAPGGPDDPAAPGMQDAPKIFSEAIYDDFQSALLLLEKRVRDGAGSIGPDEVSKFEEETDRIVAEMREYMADPKGCGERIRKGYESKVEIDVTATEQKEEAPKLSEPLATKTAIKPEPTIAAESPPPAAAAIPPPATTGDDDGPSEDSVTFGMARGTANTFIIPGMDEMSGEEYRAKLQETVSAHQAHRRRQSLAANKGKIGNANSQSYLESLGSGGGNTGLGAPGGGKKKQGENSSEDVDSVVNSSSVDGGGDSSRSVSSIGSSGNVENEKENDSNSSSSKNNLVDELLEQQRRRQERLQNEHARLGGTTNKRVDKNKHLKEELNHTGTADEDLNKEGSMCSSDTGEANFDKGEDVVDAEDVPPRDDGGGVGHLQQQQLNNATRPDAVVQKLQDLSSGGGSSSSAQKAGSAVKNNLDDQCGNEEVRRIAKTEPLITDEAERQEWLEEQIRLVDERLEARYRVMTEEKRTVLQQDAPAMIEPGNSEEEKERGSPISPPEADELLVEKTEGKSPFATFKQRKFNLERSRKTEWQEVNDEDIGGGTNDQVAKMGGRFKMNKQAIFVDNIQVDDVDEAESASQQEEEDDDASLPNASDDSALLDQKTLSVTSDSSLSSFNEEDWRGNQQKRQRPVPDSERRDGTATFFGRVHQMASTFTSKPLRASRKVSKESTRSFVHGDEENSQRPPSTLNQAAQSQNVRVSDHRGPGDVRESIVSRKQASQEVSNESTQSFVHGNEANSQRPVMSTRTNPNARAINHRGPGDIRSPNKRSSIESPTRSSAENVGSANAKKSLVEIEDRIRPVPSTDRPEYTKAADHRGVGDMRQGRNSNSHEQGHGPSTKVSLHSSSSLVETEDRIRPSPSSNMPEYAQISNHRSVGDMRDPKATMASPASMAKSLVETEERIRPTPLSSLPEYALVKDRRSVGDSKARRQSSVHAATVSLVQTEGRVRPVVKSSSVSKYAQVRDRRSVGDSRDPDRSRQHEEAVESSSLIKKEQRSRPIASSRKFPPGYIQGTDHRGPGDNNSLTKGVRAAQQQSVAPLTATSLSKAEQRIRPSPTSSDQFRNVQVSDHRGPGDDNAMTKRFMESSSSSSLSEAELRVRPTPYSNKSPNARATDHRDVGDTRTLTKKVKLSSSAAIASLSEDERQQRPMVASGGSGQSQAGDHRDPGDTRTLTKKVQSSVTPFSALTSLSEDEVRQRPAPSSNRSHRDCSNKEAGDASASGKRSPDEAASTSKAGEHWWNENTQRPRADSSSSNAEVLDRAADGAQKQAVGSSSPSLPEKEEPPSSALKSLLREDEKRSVSERKQAAVAAKQPPIAAITPSSLQSLLKDNRPADDIKEKVHKKPADGYYQPAVTPSSKLSSLLEDKKHGVPPRSQRNEKPSASNRIEWWNEKPERPRGYVKHYQPMNASYVKKFEPPRDYGDVVQTGAVLDDDENGDDGFAAADAAQEDDIDQK